MSRSLRVMRDTLRHYTPAPVAAALLQNGGRLEPVEAEATLLMCDIAGFAALTDRLGPRGVFDFLNRYFELLVSIVERHGGVVTQFQGDAILAAFNVPVPHADHAQRALRAALDIVQTCQGHRCAGEPVSNRIGISTGRVVAGAVGSRGRLSYTVHGNAVNLAARLEVLNKKYGTRMLLSAETAKRCASFRLRRLGPARIRGYSRPIELYTPA